jgi:hypothetical protein
MAAYVTSIGCWVHHFDTVDIQAGFADLLFCQDPRRRQIQFSI